MSFNNPLVSSFSTLLTRQADFYETHPDNGDPPYAADVPCMPVLGTNTKLSGTTVQNYFGSMPAEEPWSMFILTDDLRAENGRSIVRNGHYMVVNGVVYNIQGTNEFDAQELGFAPVFLHLKDIQ